MLAYLAYQSRDTNLKIGVMNFITKTHNQSLHMLPYKDGAARHAQLTLCRGYHDQEGGSLGWRPAHCTPPG